MTLKQAQDYQASLPAGRRRRSQIFRWFTALDNYEPTREHANGHAVSFILPDSVTVGLVLTGIDKLMIPANAVYVVMWPYGTAVAMYPVAWHGNGDEYGQRVVLHPYPPDAAFGPKRSYLIRLVEMN